MPGTFSLSHSHYLSPHPSKSNLVPSPWQSTFHNQQIEWRHPWMFLFRDPTKWLFLEACEIFVLVMYNTCQFTLWQSPDASRCSDTEAQSVSLKSKHVLLSGRDTHIKLRRTLQLHKSEIINVDKGKDLSVWLYSDHKGDYLNKPRPKDMWTATWYLYTNSKFVRGS